MLSRFRMWKYNDILFSLVTELPVYLFVINLFVVKKIWFSHNYIFTRRYILVTSCCFELYDVTVQIVTWCRDAFAPWWQLFRCVTGYCHGLGNSCPEEMKSWKRLMCYWELRQIIDVHEFTTLILNCWWNVTQYQLPLDWSGQASWCMSTWHLWRQTHFHLQWGCGS